MPCAAGWRLRAWPSGATRSATSSAGSATRDRRTLLIGSHLDTVRDAGRYDGMLGVLVAIACLERLRDEGRSLPYAVEVLAFADEEGVRFGTGYLGSSVVAGRFDSADLERRDADGVTLGRRSACLRRRPGGTRERPPRSGRSDRLLRGPHRAGPGARGRRRSARRRHRDRRSDRRPGRVHRRSGARRHGADGAAPRRTGRGSRIRDRGRSGRSQTRTGWSRRSASSRSSPVRGM